MFTLFLIGGQSIPLTEDQYQSVLQALNRGEKMIHLADSRATIFAHSISSILPTEEVKKNQQLKVRGNFECHAGKVHQLGDPGDPHAQKCDCPRKTDALVSPQIQNLLGKVKIKSFPTL